MSPDRAFLTIEALIAYMVDSTAWRNITFTPADISGGSPVTVFHRLPAGFFDRHQNVIEIPAEMLGKTVTINFEPANGAGKLSDEVIDRKSTRLNSSH